MKNFIIFLIINYVICFGYLNIYVGQTTVQADEPTPKQPALIITPFPIALSLDKESKDQRGTDVTNIYNLTVNFADAKYSNDNVYTIMYFIDDRPLEEFKGQRLPFTLKRNYKGLAEGDHEIKIDVEDGKGNVLATKTATVHVSHNKRN